MTPRELHNLEVQEKYPDAIDAMERALQANPDNAELITRLGFNLWYAVAEEGRLGLSIPTSEYSARFMGLLIEHRDRLCDNADFCWAFGLGLSLFWFMFPGATEELGEGLLSRAKSLDPFWEPGGCQRRRS